MPGLLGLVVAFHPDRNLLQYVQSYLPGVDRLLLVDNSVPPTPWLFELKQSNEKIYLLANNANAGIARALNQGFEYASQHSFDWVLTMDHDSHFDDGALQKMKVYATAALDDVAIIAPHHLTPKAKPLSAPGTKELKITMTSGNMVRVSAWNKSGPFEEKLFIDSVDHEYCLRLRKNGYRIIRIDDAVLHHALGEIQYHHFLGLRLKTTNHSDTRRYYITRNRLYVMFRYFTFDLKFFRREFFESIKAFFAVLLLEREKGKKLAAIYRGTRDFLLNRYGKI